MKKLFNLVFLSLSLHSLFLYVQQLYYFEGRDFLFAIGINLKLVNNNKP